MSAPAEDPTFEELLRFIKDARGFDYTAYKRPSLMRRFAKRMEAVEVESYEDYQHYLEAEPREFAELFDTILINVTSFFRDSPAWEYLRTDLLPAIVERKKEGAPIRIWSAGCSSGEEAYSAAILLAETLGDEAFRRRVKIYATDVDEDALTQARHGEYTAKTLEPMSEELRNRYFQPSDGAYAVRGDIRRSVIFGRNDLLSDAPISRVDLLLSRNTLMYFAAPAQVRILSNFYFALDRDGYLFLGKAEALQARSDFFQPLNLKHRVFVRNADGGVERRVEHAAAAAAPAVVSPGEESLRHAGFDLSPVPQFVVDLSEILVAANHHARALFGISHKDINRPLRDLEISYRPLEIRSRIELAMSERRPVHVRDVTWALPDEPDRHYDVQLSPLSGPGGELLGVAIAWVDVSRYHALRLELEQSRRDLETAYEELQSAVEELETTNEELQSTNEELETTNEELQSTNEELETTNEELQSTNEELETMNDELRERTDDALRANSFFESILASVEQSVIVVDPQVRITAWSDAAADLWGLRSDEVQGEFLFNLDIGLPVEELRVPIRSAIAGDGPIEDVVVKARNRRGQAVVCTISFSHLSVPGGDGHGAILMVGVVSREEDAA